MAQQTTITQDSVFDVRYLFLDEMNGMSTEIVKNVSFKTLKQQFENEKRNREYAVLGFHYQVVDAVFLDGQKIDITNAKKMIEEASLLLAA